MKQRLQGAVVGVLVAILLFGTASVWASASNREIEVTFGNFRTTVWGREFTTRNAAGEVLQPFYFGGSVYVPVEAVLYAMRANAQWNEQTGTLNFGTAYQAITPQPTPTPTPIPVIERIPIQQTAPFFDTTSQFTQGFNVGETPVINIGNPMMGGETYNNSIIFRTRSGSLAHNSPTIAEMSTLHNLRGNYTRLIGYVGRVDGSANTGATLRIYGDGTRLAEYNLTALGMPTEINLSVAGVTQLRIMIITGQFRNANGIFQYAFQAFLE